MGMLRMDVIHDTILIELCLNRYDTLATVEVRREENGNKDINGVLSRVRKGFGGLNILRTRFSLVGRMHRFPIKFFPAPSRHVLPVAH